MSASPTPTTARSRPIPPPPRQRPDGSAPPGATPGAPQETNATSWMVVRPWSDPIVDDHGHDPRSAYVERFWLGVLGPTATWVLRRLARGLDAEPAGYCVDLVATARTMGLSYEPVGRPVREAEHDAAVERAGER